MMDTGVRVVISNDGIEILEPGDLTIRALRVHRRAAELLRGHPFWAASTARAWFRMGLVGLHIGRELHHAKMSLPYRIRRYLG